MLATGDINLIDPALYQRGRPHHLWRVLRDQAPVYWHAPWREYPGFWALTRHQEVSRVFNDPRSFTVTSHLLVLNPRAPNNSRGDNPEVPPNLAAAAAAAGAVKPPGVQTPGVQLPKPGGQK